MVKTDPLYRRHRFSPDIIRRCVWLYYRFSLSYRDVELMMVERTASTSRSYPNHLQLINSIIPIHTSSGVALADVIPFLHQ